MAQQEETFKKIVSHCKEYGFVFPSSEIYDGLGAVYDYGQMGVELKNNIIALCDGDTLEEETKEKATPYYLFWRK